MANPFAILTEAGDGKQVLAPLHDGAREMRFSILGEGEMDRREPRFLCSLKRGERCDDAVEIFVTALRFAFGQSAKLQDRGAVITTRSNDSELLDISTVL